MEANKEAVTIVCNNDKEPIVLVKRDDKSTKTLLYALKEMNADDITNFINSGDKLEIK